MTFGSDDYGLSFDCSLCDAGLCIVLLVVAALCCLLFAVQVPTAHRMVSAHSEHLAQNGQHLHQIDQEQDDAL